MGLTLAGWQSIVVLKAHARGCPSVYTAIRPVRQGRAPAAHSLPPPHAPNTYTTAPCSCVRQQALPLGQRQTVQHPLFTLCFIALHDRSSSGSTRVPRRVEYYGATASVLELPTWRRRVCLYSVLLPGCRLTKQVTSRRLEHPPTAGPTYC